MDDKEIKTCKYNEYTVYYISDIDINNENVQYVDKLVVCYAVTCKSNTDTIILTWLEVNFNHRGHGFGTRLLRYIINDCMCNNISFIELDDMSQHAWDIDRNIYIKHGFLYKNSYPSPEMVLHIDNTTMIDKCINSLNNIML